MEISCSVELSIKESFITSGPVFTSAQPDKFLSFLSEETLDPGVSIMTPSETLIRMHRMIRALVGVYLAGHLLIVFNSLHIE